MQSSFDFGRTDREQIRSRINNNDCRTFRLRRPLSTAYRTFDSHHLTCPQSRFVRCCPHSWSANCLYQRCSGIYRPSKVHNSHMSCHFSHIDISRISHCLCTRSRNSFLNLGSTGWLFKADSRGRERHRKTFRTPN